MIIGRFWQKLKQTFSRQTFRAPEPEHAIHPHKQNLKPEKVGTSKHEAMVAWCRSFNARNGYVVPDKSPESIYYKTHRGRV